ncbi:hypothetical protein GP486_000434 [Trichoglossum hirsutum]|uniref:Uncharacterized protein n=1 Tax=Trichoglossum hirsutum TaxID=265104 RepID=A0A9P8LIK7_9PEZI|nr:hypothetical protein GP486_000434 [Trichoglossum hirsutum]
MDHEKIAKLLKDLQDEDKRENAIQELEALNKSFENGGSCTIPWRATDALYKSYAQVSLSQVSEREKEEHLSHVNKILHLANGFYTHSDATNLRQMDNEELLKAFPASDGDRVWAFVRGFWVELLVTTDAVHGIALAAIRKDRKIGEKIFSEKSLAYHIYRFSGEGPHLLLNERSLKILNSACRILKRTAPESGSEIERGGKKPRSD